jgi:hypothetical protein
MSNMLVKNADGGVTPLGGVADAAKVYLASLLSGEDPIVGGLAVFAAGSEYVAGSATTDAADITLGANGAAGDLLEEVVVRNGSGSSAVTLAIKDGTTELLAYRITIALGVTARVPVGLRSRNGGWKINLDAATAGEIGNMHYCANGSFS